MAKKIVLINPNSTQAMTDSCSHTLTRLDGVNINRFIFLTNAMGPAAIQGVEDGEQAKKGLFELIQKYADNECIIIACFDDIGLIEARQKYTLPIIGLGQAAFLSALVYAPFFVVLTTMSDSIPVIEEAIENLNLSACCTAVVASGIPVLELERKKSESLDVLNEFIQDLSIRYPNIPIVLGCAGMTVLFDRLQEKNRGVRLIDPVRSALLLAANNC